MKPAKSQFESQTPGYKDTRPGTISKSAHKANDGKAGSNYRRMVDANSSVGKKDKDINSMSRKMNSNAEETITANTALLGTSIQDLDARHKSEGTETPISGDALARAKSGSKTSLHKD